MPDKQKPKLIIEKIQTQMTEEPVSPPPPNLVSNFTTIGDWLANLCRNNKTEDKVTEYRFHLFESVGNNVLAVAGVEIHQDEKYNWVTRIVHEPENNYFILPDQYFGSLAHQQMLEKLTTELKEFTYTDLFQTSFFAKAMAVVFDRNGVIIWKKH